MCCIKLSAPLSGKIFKYSASRTVVYNERGPGLSELEGRRANPQNPIPQNPKSPLEVE